VKARSGLELHPPLAAAQHGHRGAFGVLKHDGLGLGVLLRDA
jgi:hypothetical protein